MCRKLLPAHRQRFWCAPKVALVRTKGCFAAHQSCRRRVGAEKGALGLAEGVEVILDPMGQHFADDLQEHIDRIRSSPLAAPGVRGAAPSVPPPKKIFFQNSPLRVKRKYGIILPKLGRGVVCADVEQVTRCGCKRNQNQENKGKQL